MVEDNDVHPPVSGRVKASVSCAAALSAAGSAAPGEGTISDDSDEILSRPDSEITVELVPHPATSSAGLQIQVEVRRAGGVLNLEYRVTGLIDALRLPKPTARVRTDGLWRTTCFEAFAGRGDGYGEYNLSPSGAWAAYGFEGYREGIAPLEHPAPMIVIRRTPETFVLTTDVMLPPDADGRLGLSAVIETLDGGISYWALEHPAEKPDFHHPDSFVLTLPESSA